ncbi:hypothetical protein EI42_01576 [Thermosporothrix hazakensis]|uniref:GAF domain-containing protein n=2 Tax=Thermosporothrix TaxID=768650 RepID=A0A326U9X0_THEHA|nr:GAF domain-containing protein [Thermosporothrix hazakensis]PZW33026.1 hypothetical protein EI42_01576 [Thermosporothrix hazakensis]BBH91007.1 hypothetical protein KTC_57580 [Thermosporothrix sp. COM3]GCE49057.1 hypothetical protein KTH_39260 [Thermosporothrix hazakensis]
MQDAQNWRELLGRIIKDPQEKRRIANALGVSTVTLGRWVSGESNPRRQNVRHLLHAIPEYRKQFLDVMQKTTGRFFTDVVDEEHGEAEIPSNVYEHILNVHCNMPKALHFNTLCDVILRHAVEQLDPHRLGIEITIMQCMRPPEGQKEVRSLREIMARGTPPWDRGLGRRTAFLGSESLAGYVVHTGRSLAIPNRNTSHFFPATWVEGEESAIAYPIMQSARVAGCLLCSSSQPDFFQAGFRQGIVQRYAELLSIAFAEDEFYELDAIELGRMPLPQIQQDYLVDFRARVTKAMVKYKVNVTEAEQIVWRELEAELLEMQCAQRESL